MITLKIYDPAMCCSSGVCGPSVNEKLVHFSTFLKGLKKDEYTIERYNLSQQPEAYASNPVVANTLKESGVEALPLVFVDDEIVFSGEYPTIDELASVLKLECPDMEKDSSDCCSEGCCG